MFDCLSVHSLSGYFVTFGLEFLCLMAEDTIKARIGLPGGLLYYPATVLAWLVRNMVWHCPVWSCGPVCLNVRFTRQVLSYSMISFMGKTWAASNPAFCSVYYVVHLAVLAVIVINAIFPAKKTKAVDDKATAKSKAE